MAVLALTEPCTAMQRAGSLSIPGTLVEVPSTAHRVLRPVMLPGRVTAATTQAMSVPDRTLAGGDASRQTHTWAPMSAMNGQIPGILVPTKSAVPIPTTNA